MMLARTSCRTIDGVLLRGFVMAEGESGDAQAELRRDFVPKSDYVSPDFDRLEFERLWPRVWQIACREEELLAVGDYVNYEIGEESILIVRTSVDCIRAFYNVCSHRGRRLQEEERGNVRAFVCRYHAWCFSLEGKPTAITSRGDWEGCPSFSNDDLSLKPVKLDLWAGFVWINMDDDCEPLQAFLAPLPEKLNNFEIEKC